MHSGIESSGRRSIALLVVATVTVTGVVVPSPSAVAVALPGATVKAKHQPAFKTYALATATQAKIMNVKIVRHKGTPDDKKGTEIQDRGIFSAPYGDWGGVQAGQVGNFFLAGHRTSHGGPMKRVPDLVPGDKIAITRDGKQYVYTVAYKLWINFRKADSRRLQTLPVPGRPGEVATKPAIVLSTCATPEDKAAGRKWQDKFGNPTHRIAAVGFIEPAPS